MLSVNCQDKLHYYKFMSAKDVLCGPAVVSSCRCDCAYSKVKCLPGYSHVEIGEGLYPPPLCNIVFFYRVLVTVCDATVWPGGSVPRHLDMVDGSLHRAHPLTDSSSSYIISSYFIVHLLLFLLNFNLSYSLTMTAQSPETKYDPGTETSPLLVYQEQAEEVILYTWFRAAIASSPGMKWLMLATFWIVDTSLEAIKTLSLCTAPVLNLKWW